MSAVPADALEVLKWLASNPLNARIKQADLVRQALDLYKTWEVTTGNLDWSTYSATTGLINAGGAETKTTTTPTLVQETAGGGNIAALRTGPE